MTTRFKTFATLSILAFAVTANGQFSKKVSVTGIAQGAGGPAAAAAPAGAAGAAAAAAQPATAFLRSKEAKGKHLCFFENVF